MVFESIFSMTMYYAAVVLPEDLNKQVLNWKIYMLEKYNCKVGLKSPAHITIIPPFWMEEEKENQFLSDIGRLSARIEPFMIETNNFSAFRLRTIFIAVKGNKQLSGLKEAVDQFFGNENPYHIKIETRPFHPHITIATRDLFKKDFNDAWSMFQQQTFEARWITKGLSVLRHNKKNWEVIFTSAFTGQ